MNLIDVFLFAGSFTVPVEIWQFSNIIILCLVDTKISSVCRWRFIVRKIYFVIRNVAGNGVWFLKTGELLKPMWKLMLVEVAWHQLFIWKRRTTSRAQGYCVSACIGCRAIVFVMRFLLYIALVLLRLTAFAITSFSFSVDWFWGFGTSRNISHHSKNWRVSMTAKNEVEEEYLKRLGNRMNFSKSFWMWILYLSLL